MEGEVAHRALIERLYTALDRHDGEAMAGCYRADGSFRDPAFGELSGAQAADMWRMLTARSQDLAVELLDHEAGPRDGSAHWRARYTFAQTGRPVVNEVRSRFVFAGGLIAEQEDDFSFWRWSRQALGLVGLLAGWTPLLRAATRRRARAALQDFTRSRPTP